MNLEKIRKDIDSIDSELFPLIVKRINLARQVAQYKNNKGLPIIDKKREQYVISAFEKWCTDATIDKRVGTILARALIDAAIEEERIVTQINS